VVGHDDQTLALPPTDPVGHDRVRGGAGVEHLGTPPGAREGGRDRVGIERWAAGSLRGHRD